MPFPASRRMILCSAATDGSLAFWDLTTAMDRGSTTLESPAHPGLPYREYRDLPYHLPHKVKAGP